jgi:hypothetical protein
MIVAIHQPHFLPWLGYLHRMQSADLFVLLDHVQFERRNYQNRTAIMVDGIARWLTVPVVQRSQKETIVEKLIDNPKNGEMRWWGPNAFRTLRFAYRRAPHLERYTPWLQEILERRWDRLAQLNEVLLDFLRDAFEIRTPFVRSSELGVSGHRAELILNLCRHLGADALLAGDGGSRSYLDEAEFARAGVRIAWQNFRHPSYPQAGAAGAFVPGLSAVDLLFNCGPQSRRILEQGAPEPQPQPQPERAERAAA